jgi:hypothetical protein
MRRNFAAIHHSTLPYRCCMGSEVRVGGGVTLMQRYGGRRCAPFRAGWWWW